MRQLYVLLVFVLGLSVSLAGYCYERQSYRECVGRRVYRLRFRVVRKCCDGYYGAFCDCPLKCDFTEYYTGTCCIKKNPSLPPAHTPALPYRRKRSTVNCYPCKKSRTVTGACNRNVNGRLCIL